MTYPFEMPASDGLDRISMLLGGSWQQGEGAAQEVFDKFRLTPFALLPASGPDQITEMIGLAEHSFRADRLTPHDRGRILDAVAALLEMRRDEFQDVMQLETGYTDADCRTEIQRTVETLRLSAEEARRLSGEVIPVAGAAGQGNRLAFTLRVPLGVVLAVTPFNAPLNTVTHKIAPALGAGNTVVLKPASQTPRTACMLAQAFLDAGLPPGYLQVFHGGAAAVEQALADDRVRYIAFTGSTEVGRLIQARAGLRRTQMELGSIAFTLLAGDADLDDALSKVAAAGYRKAGQVCTSVQILLVDAAIADQVESRLAGIVAELTHGDPAMPGCSTGPLISLGDALRVESWIAEAISGGARLLAGGRRDGAVIAPTLLADVTPAMNVGCREIFGPVVCIERFTDFDAALERVNATPYGLATGIFTRNLDLAFAALRRLQVGGVHVNQTSSARLDMMPYGGSKESGFGREGPRHAMMEMTEERVVSFTL
ncbi:aldehyde dehydrogenase family protein [Paracoccus sp. MBLB3053]|uniref:Aldehyde dehydrogenase family protein n=1 Tax=Paracoccus aurantius TaxID=3073814 RepID=A0ABU2HXP2_9RHOB|nr:aldehyde dehydrogenase family protein [Paracoccus sp. MBLB3053]MDS9469827.1 aldehyde dehydrogenase family protein [Paracoccus sp. MBLB3053]